MKETEMEDIASIMGDALKEDARKDEIRERIHRLVSRFDSVEYSLK